MEPNNNTPAEIIEIDSTGIVMAQSKAEIDMQIATAKQYPRNISQCLNDIVTWGTMDTETAESCFYSLQRGSRNGGTAAIEGLSVRMAEIIAEAWGNLRADSRVVSNNGKTITAQAVCMDLERNVAIRTEVQQRITGRDGKTYGEDMQVNVANSACSKAFRNAVLKVVPKAITAKAVEEIRKVAKGQAVNLVEKRTSIIGAFGKLGVKEEELLTYLDIKTRDEMDLETVMHLKGLYVAIKEGDTNIEEAIRIPNKEKSNAKRLAEAGSNTQNRAAVIAERAMEKAAEAQSAPANK